MPDLTASPTQDQPATRLSEADLEFLVGQTTSLVDFAKRSPHPDGGFAWLDDDGNPLLDRPVELWISCRMLHVLALAEILGDASCRPLVADGLAALRGRLRDDEGLDAIGREELRDAGERIACGCDPDQQAGEPDRLRHDNDGDHSDPARREPTEEVPDAPHQAAGEREQRGHQELVVADRARGGLRVELVRVVEDGGLGRAHRRPVVVARDRVEQLCEHGRVEVAGSLLDHPQPKVHVSEQAALLGLAEGRTTSELPDAPDVVEERRCEQQVVTEAGMELCGLAAQRRDADRVLEQAARVPVMPVRAGGGESSIRRPDRSVPDEGVDHGTEPFVCDLRCEELEEAVQLVGVAA